VVASDEYGNFFCAIGELCALQRRADDSNAVSYSVSVEEVRQYAGLDRKIYVLSDISSLFEDLCNIELAYDNTHNIST
jgi:hypothetical protein